jgi:hypothetical protein
MPQLPPPGDCDDDPQAAPMFLIVLVGDPFAAEAGDFDPGLDYLGSRTAARRSRRLPVQVVNAADYLLRLLMAAPASTPRLP